MASASALKFVVVVLLRTLYSGGAVMGEEAETEISNGSRDGPKLQLPAQNITVMAGKVASVNCTMIYLELYKISRTPNDPKRIETEYLRVVNMDSRATLLTRKGRKYALVIKDAEAEVNGPHGCKIYKDPMGSQRFFFDEAGGTVAGEKTERKISTDSRDAPEFPPPGQNITVMTGSPDSAGCTILYLQLFKFGFIGNDPRAITTLHFRVITRDPRADLLTLKGRTYTLIVDNSGAKGSGSHSCRVNRDPMKSTRFAIDVPDNLLDASIPGSDLDEASSEELEATEVMPTTAVLAGHTASLRCSKNSIAGHEISWFNEDTGKVLSIGENIISSDSRILLRHEANKSVNLLIKDVQLEDGGIYACHLNTDPNETLYFMLRVMDAPDVKSSSMKLSREQSQLLVTFQCTIHGVPYPFLYWSKDGNSLNVTGKNREVTQNRHGYGKGSTSLIMQNVSVDDVGIYRCHAENSLGSRSARFGMTGSMINSGADPEVLTTSPNLHVGNSNVGASLNMPSENITATIG